MNNYTRFYEQSKGTIVIDKGLQRYMAKVYLHMAGALLITATAASAVLAYTPLTRLLFNVDGYGRILSMTPLAWVIFFAPLGIGFLIRGASISPMRARLLLVLHAACVGLSVSELGIYYTIDSVHKVFLITAIVFALMGVYGYTTKHDLSGVGSFCIMGIFGIVIAFLVNCWFKSEAVSFIAEFVGIFIFTAFTAYQHQMIKERYIQDSSEAEKEAVVSALLLYVNFINLFLRLLYFLGDRRRQD